MMDWLKKLAESASAELTAQVGRFKNRDFMEAVVAGCAMVAAADGTIDASEKQKMIGFMQISEELKVFSTDDVIAAFNRAASKFEFDYEIGRLDALKVVGKLQSNLEAARVMVRVCCLIGAADGNFDDDEKKAVSSICKAVGLKPAEFELPA